MRDWEDRRRYLMEEARRDLEAGLEVRPCLVAMAGDRRLFLAFLRPFPRRAHLDALLELLALAAPLDADRLALSISGRAWSMKDPIPPIVPGIGDLRQRVLTILEADGSAGRASVDSTIIPFEVTAGRLRWGEAHSEHQESGALSRALVLAIRHRRRLRASDRDIRLQAQRCIRLGHLLAFAEPLHERLLMS